MGYIGGEFSLAARMDGFTYQLLPKKPADPNKPPKEKKPKKEKPAKVKEAAAQEKAPQSEAPQAPAPAGDDTDLFGDID